ncbi:MAG: hypothetical protein HY395_02990 [Candidatus Doudnabacteria bacterium]|nr:hypothetical protein [Candidatus Doudnabacteria bacterium]
MTKILNFKQTSLDIRYLKFEFVSNFVLRASILAMVLVLILPSFVLAQGAVDLAFNPGLLITDEAFADVGTFGSAAGIQKFLEQKGSVLANTSSEFLIKLREPDTLTKVGLEDPQPNLGRLRTAAELIYDAAVSKGLNPQVILVTLQKEQSLITGSFNDTTLQSKLNKALGFACPDYEGCDDIFQGFYRQLFGTFDAAGSRWLGAAASLMKSFRTEVGGVRVGRGPGVDANNQTFGRPVVRTARKGDAVIFDNTLGGYDGVLATQSVTLGNFATAALYRYTPHVFNGNYNFWKFYTAWFKYPNGTIIQLLNNPTLYVIDNGAKRPFSQFVATQRKLDLTKVITVSQTEFDTYFTEKPMPPLDGTLIKGDVSPAVYLIEDTKKHALSYPVFVQRKFSFAKVVTVSQAELDSYETGSFVAPLDGTLITGEADKTVYLIDAGLKRPITYEVFVARKFSFAKLMKLTDGEVAGIPSGQFVLPPESVALKLKNDTAIYWFKDGQKRYVSAFVYKQRGVANFPHVIIGQDEFNQIPTGSPFPPKDGTVIKGDQSTAIYRIENGLKRLLTAAAYKRLGYPKATVLAQGEVDNYASGETMAK